MRSALAPSSTRISSPVAERFTPHGLVFSRAVGASQKFRLRSAGYKRDIVTELEDGVKLVDRQSGTPFVVVGEVLPAGDSSSSLPWSAENLRLCGCAREQLVQKDVNDCPYCDRRIPAAQEPNGDVAG